MRYADVIVNIASLNKSFQYRVPTALENELELGTAVHIPFGKGDGQREGFIIGFSDRAEIEEVRIKEITGIAEKKNPVEARLIRLAAHLRAIYGGTMQQALAAVLPVKDRKTSHSQVPELQEPVADAVEEPLLSPQQKHVFNEILQEWAGQDRPALLQGVTGSGKTLLYMELAARVLAENRQVIVLIPEIALSWQTVRRFRRRFGDLVTVMNSRMSAGERSRQFDRMKSGEAQIVIGPRSALFAPFPSLGLIVIDEEQESAYRSEQVPRYDCREVARYRAAEEQAHLLFGSATPSVDSYYLAEKGEFSLFRLPDRAGQAALPKTRIVDMREEQRQGNRTLLSKPLEEAMHIRLDNGEQTMLFLNRRGYSGVQTCQSCGTVLQCKHCNVSLTLHTRGRLVCHYCGFEMPLPKVCPSCGSPHLQGFRYGTEKVERDVQRLFPQARILRMDADTTRRKQDYIEILGAFSRREADVLIGTQMIVKGHDFPGVTLVGILAADVSLFANEFRAQERTYQLLVQAAGRAGRGELAGEAIIQTQHPEHDCIRQAVQQDYQAFYEEEIAGRELAGYPPAEQMLAIHGSAAEEERLMAAMEALRHFLLREAEEKQLIGPAPETVSRKKDRFLSVLYMRDTDRQRLLRNRLLTEKYIAMNRGFKGMRFSYELNP